MKKEILLPAVAWLGGIGGFALRRWELAQGYDPQLRLVASGKATWLLWGLMGALLVLFAASCFGMGKKRRTPQKWFYVPATGYIMLVVAAGFLLMASGFAGLLQQRNLLVKETMLLLTYGLCILGGGCLLCAGQDSYRGHWSKHTPLLYMGPAFTMLVWLIAAYQRSAKQPQIGLYVWQMLSAVAVVLAVYTLVTLAVGRGGAGRACLFCLLGISLSLTALADGQDVPNTLVYLSALLYLTAQSWMLLRAAFGKPRRSRMPQGADRDEQTDTNE